MPQQQLSAVVTTTVEDLTLTPSGRFVRVRFAPVRVPGAFANCARPGWPIHPAPICGYTRMTLNEVLCKDIRAGDLVELTLAGKMPRPTVLHVYREARVR